jgi:hypothetical protein
MIIGEGFGGMGESFSVINPIKNINNIGTDSAGFLEYIWNVFMKSIVYKFRYFVKNL